MRDTTSALTIPWDQDPICLDIMARYPDGAPSDAIAAAYGRHRRAIEQTEAQALRKLAKLSQLRELLREAQDDEAENWWDVMVREVG